MRIFNLDSPFMQFLTKVANLMILNMLVLVCSLPLITGGASMTAMYYVTLKMAKGEEPYIIKGFFKSFKENFRQATAIWVILLAVTALIAADWSIIIHGMEGRSAQFMKIVMFVISVFLALTALYVFPVLSRFENTVKQTIKNSFLMSILNLPKSILIVIVHLLPVGLILISVSMVPVVFLLGLSVAAYLSSKLYVKIFKRFEPEDANASQSDELQPLSFIVEEEREKQAALEREAQAAEAGENGDADAARKDGETAAGETAEGPDGEKTDGIPAADGSGGEKAAGAPEADGAAADGDAGTENEGN